jgi:hypothetical protein
MIRLIAQGVTLHRMEYSMEGMKKSVEATPLRISERSVRKEAQKRREKFGNCDEKCQWGWDVRHDRIDHAG